MLWRVLDVWGVLKVMVSMLTSVGPALFGEHGLHICSALASKPWSWRVRSNAGEYIFPGYLFLWRGKSAYQMVNVLFVWLLEDDVAVFISTSVYCFWWRVLSSNIYIQQYPRKYFEPSRWFGPPVHLLLRVVFILVPEPLIFWEWFPPLFLFLFYLFAPCVQIWCLILPVRAFTPGHRISGASAVLMR